MSTSGFVVVRLDVLTTQERADAVHRVADWLTSTGVVAPLGESLLGPQAYPLGGWGPGPAWKSAAAVPVPDAWDSSSGEDVDICSDRRVVSAMGNSEDFTCPRCATQISSGDRLGALIDEWLERGEPVATCVSCGWAAPLGDWPSAYPPGLVGAPSVTFYRWPPLAIGFADVLISHIGGRCRTFWTRL